MPSSYRLMRARLLARVNLGCVYVWLLQAMPWHHCQGKETSRHRRGELEMKKSAEPKYGEVPRAVG